MNWKPILTDSPDAYALALAEFLPGRPAPGFYNFLDRHALHLVLTYQRDADHPWDYELHGHRFIREQCRYASRAEAEQAGMETAFEELNKLVLQGNA